MANIENLKLRIKAYLEINNMPCSEVDIDEFIYSATNKTLLCLQYGTDPIDKNNKQKGVDSVDDVPTEELKQEVEPAASVEDKHDFKPSKIKITKK